jgi:hypothetical protein
VNTPPLIPDTPRPRLLYFNGPWDYSGARVILSYIEPLRRLLEQDFEVISVEGDCDFRREVTAHRPDLVLFHSGVESMLERESGITNTDAFPELPRIGFLHRDPFSPSRLAAMNRLRAWGVHQVFTIFRASDSPIPYFSDCIYVPWWVDDTIFRDYGEPKTLPITLTGSGWLNRMFYTWRHPVFVQLAQRLPVYHVPAFETHQKNDAYVGESYARLLNRSLISGGCGTVCRYLTLKVLEIPASRSCLLTEEIEVLKAIGFIDGVNCVFVDEKNVVAKVQALLDEPARLQAITDAGYELVHTRHRRGSRRMFAEWLALWKARRPGERIAQVHPLEPLRLVPDGEAVTSTFPRENPLMERLQSGYRLMAESRWKEALDAFAWVLGVIPYVAEANLGTAICQLELGQPAGALQQLEHIFAIQAKLCNYPRPDPISLAYLAVAHAKLNQSDRAVELLGKHVRLKHPALNALRWLAAQRWETLRARYSDWEADEGCEEKNTETLHLLPARNFAGWVDHWSACLPAGQTAELRT